MRAFCERRPTYFHDWLSVPENRARSLASQKQHRLVNRDAILKRRRELRAAEPEKAKADLRKILRS
jgi:hypothetical protein